MKLIFRQIIRNFASHGCKKGKPKCEQPSKPKKSRPPAGCIVGPSGVHPAVEGGLKLWRNMFFFLCLPMIGLVGFNVKNTYEEPKRQEFVKLPYMRIRHKLFPWCGGTNKSYFHNPRINPLPDGYEDDEE